MEQLEAFVAANSSLAAAYRSFLGSETSSWRIRGLPFQLLAQRRDLPGPSRP